RTPRPGATRRMVLRGAQRLVSFPASNTTEGRIANGDLILAVEVAKDFNVERQAIYGWAARNNRRLVRHKGRLYISLADLEDYARTDNSARVPQRPRGWPTRKSLEQEFGGATTYLIRLERSGK